MPERAQAHEAREHARRRERAGVLLQRRAGHVEVAGGEDDPLHAGLLQRRRVRVHLRRDDHQARVLAARALRDLDRGDPPQREAHDDARGAGVHLAVVAEHHRAHAGLHQLTVVGTVQAPARATSASVLGARTHQPAARGRDVDERPARALRMPAHAVQHHRHRSRPLRSGFAARRVHVGLAGERFGLHPRRCLGDARALGRLLADRSRHRGHQVGLLRLRLRRVRRRRRHPHARRAQHRHQPHRRARRRHHARSPRAVSLPEHRSLLVLGRRGDCSRLPVSSSPEEGRS